MQRIRSMPGLSSLLACLALLVVWDLLARGLDISGLTPPSRAFRQLPSLLLDPETLVNLLASLRRMAIGFFLAVFVAVPVGLVMGRSRVVAAIMNPISMVIYPVPKAALMPIIMLWLGVGDTAKILVIFLGVSLPVIYHSFQGSNAVEQKMLWSAAAMGLGAPARLWRIVLPGALPEIMVGCRTGLVLALITMVTSEMIARQTGIGNLFFTALDMGEYDTVYAMIVVIGLLGFLLDWGFEAVRRVLLVWAEPAHEIAVGSA